MSRLPHHLPAQARRQGSVLGLILLLITLGIISIAVLYSTRNRHPLSLDQRLEGLLRLRSPDGSTDHYRLPHHRDLANIPADAQNPLTPAKVRLGKLLFHETALLHNPTLPKGHETASCASCHHVDAGFAAGIPQSIGEGGIGFGIAGEGRVRDPDYLPSEMDVQPVKAPTAMNVAYQPNVLWNGALGGIGLNAGRDELFDAGTPFEANFLGLHGLETQAIAALNVHRLTEGPGGFLGDAELSTTVTDNPQYRILFQLAFPGVPESELFTSLYAGLAIGAYEHTLLSHEAPFQRWLRGNNRSMTRAQKRGAILFFGKAGCADCHDGPALSSMSFHAFGMGDLIDRADRVHNLVPNDPANTGRQSFTHDPADAFKFKTPQLYNLKDSPFYGHGSSFESIADVVAYKNAGVKQNANVPDSALSPAFQPLGLTQREMRDLTAFIADGLYDRHLQRFVPRRLPSGNAFPNNDPVSREDLGYDQAQQNSN